MIDEKKLQGLIDYIKDRKDNGLDYHVMTQHDWLFNNEVDRSEWQLYFNRANPPKINENLLDEYKYEKSCGFSEHNWNEEDFFRENDIPISHWEEYRWRSGESARQALAEKEKRTAEALTVGQLIERLKEFPADMLACVRGCVGFNGINQLSIVKDLQPHYNSYYVGNVAFKCEQKVEVLLLEGFS